MKFLIFLILIHFVVGAPKPTAKVEVQKEEKLKYEPEKTPVSEEEIEDVVSDLLNHQHQLLDDLLVARIPDFFMISI